MTRYRERPPSFEARQFKGMTTEEDWQFVKWLGERGSFTREQYGLALRCQVADAQMVLRAGDWVVETSGGQFVVLSDVEFRSAYEPEPQGAPQ